VEPHKPRPCLPQAGVATPITPPWGDISRLVTEQAVLSWPIPSRGYYRGLSAGVIKGVHASSVWIQHFR